MYKSNLKAMREKLIAFKHTHLYGAIQFNNGFFEKKCVICGYKEDIEQDNSRFNETIAYKKPVYFINASEEENLVR